MSIDPSWQGEPVQPLPELPHRAWLCQEQGTPGHNPQYPPGHCALLRGLLCPVPCQNHQLWVNLSPEAWIFSEDSGEQLQNLTSEPMQEQGNTSQHFRITHHCFTVFRSVFSNGGETCKHQGKDHCTGHQHHEGLWWGHTRPQEHKVTLITLVGPRLAEGRRDTALDRHRTGPGREHRPSSCNPCELHAALLPFTALLPTTAPYVPPAKPGAQRGTESKGLSPSRQPEFTSTQTSSASRAERCSVERKGEESRDGSEQTPHKAHDVQLENSSKICFPVASPKSTPFVPGAAFPYGALSCHTCVFQVRFGLTALIPQLNQSSPYFPPLCRGLFPPTRFLLLLQVPCTVT